MIYDGTDLNQIFSVTKYDGIGAPSLRTTMWSPTKGNGDRIAIARQPNKTVKVTFVIESDDAGDMADKVEALYSIFRIGKEFVDIQFEEDDSLLYKGRVTSVQRTAYHFTVAEYVITLTCLPFRYGEWKTVRASGNRISGDNMGTAPSAGYIVFTIANDPDSITVQIQNRGAIQLVKPSDDDLNGDWIIDLETRTVYRDNALAMEVVGFENTTFETAEVPAGNFVITFDSTVTNASYSYQEVFL